MDNNTENIELRSAEFQEIVGQSPHWLIRSGLSLVLGIIVLLLSGSYFFRYPGLIRSEVLVVTRFQPALITSPASGMIDSLLVPDHKNFSENPVEEPRTFGIIILTQDDAFQLSKGQTVNIRFNFWPGSVSQPFVGTVQTITSMSAADNYKVEVQLPSDFITEYRKLFPSFPEIKGTAEVITEKRRLIEKLIQPIQLLINNDSQGSN
jgi:hypothetical protein